MDLGGPFDQFALSLRVCQGRRLDGAYYSLPLFSDAALQPTFATDAAKSTRSRLQACVVGSTASAQHHLCFQPPSSEPYRVPFGTVGSPHSPHRAWGEPLSRNRMRRVHASDSLTSQALVTFRDTLPRGYPRSAAPLPPASPITGDTLSTTSAPSTTMCRATITGPHTGIQSRHDAGLARSIPSCSPERPSLDGGRPFVPFNRLVVDRPWLRESVSRRL